MTTISKRMRWLGVLMLATAWSMHAAAEQAAGQGAPPAQEIAALRQRVAELEAEVQRLQAENRKLAELAGMVPEAEMVEVEEAYITTRKDPDTGAATTTTRWVKLPIASGDRSDHQMMATMGEDGSARLVVGAHFTNRLYLGMKDVTLVVDDKEITRPVVDYSSRRRGSAGPRSGSLYGETVQIDLGADLLRQLAGARAAELRMRHVRATLDREQLAQFKALAARMP